MIKPAEDQKSYNELLKEHTKAIVEGNEDKRELCEALLRLYDIEQEYVSNMFTEPENENATGDLHSTALRSFMPLVDAMLFDLEVEYCRNKVSTPTKYEYLWATLFIPLFYLFGFYKYKGLLDRVGKKLEDGSNIVNFHDAFLLMGEHFADLLYGSWHPTCNCSACSYLTKLSLKDLFQEIRGELLKVAINPGNNKLNV